ncbi:MULTISPECIES: helix-turn-helix domain-containing protein [Curtobacterium]|uniref:helix-turn-helix domain-containing protein n=1 Tax=Curtobacterium flaccumfaciens TaxID=2035 RepID=UPI003EE53355
MRSAGRGSGRCCWASCCGRSWRGRASGCRRRSGCSDDPCRVATHRRPLRAEEQPCRAIRFSTLTALCDVLGCQPGDLFSVRRP